MDKIILICATGRSGSTTLQRIINTIPNSNICGENNGALNNLLEFYKNIKYSTINFIPGHLIPVCYEKIIEAQIKPSWYNSYDFQQITNTIKLLITQMFKNSETTTIWGFKEIRYFNGNINLIKEFKELFPQTKVIIQVKIDIQTQSKSGWFKNDTNSINTLKKYNKELYDFYLGNRSYCFFTTFEKMFDHENIKNIFKFIDCEEYYNVENITQILENNLKD